MSLFFCSYSVLAVEGVGVSVLSVFFLFFLLEGVGVSVLLLEGVGVSVLLCSTLFYLGCLCSMFYCSIVSQPKEIPAFAGISLLL